MYNQPVFNRPPNNNLIIQDNLKLKKELQSFQEREKIYKSSIEKLKKFQHEYQKSFNKALNDYKLHEEQIKKTYINYQKLIENHYKENENRFLEENTKLNMEIKQKNIIIKNLNNKIRHLNQKLNRMENDFQFENKKLESEVVSKERRLSELNESMIQLARNTNDEIKLLRDEFEIFNNKRKKIKRYQSFEKTDYDIPFNNDNYYSNSRRKIRNFGDNEKYTNKDIDYLIDRVNLLENQNRNLRQKLKRKEEELIICNKLKNELFFKNNMKNYFSSNPNDNNDINKLKLSNSSNNYRNKRHYNNIKYNNFSNKTQKDIYEPNINYKHNNLNQNYNLFKEKRENIKEKKIHNYPEYDQFLNNYDINELIITSNQNDFYNFNSFGENNMINQIDGIKDEYINSRLPKINTLDY